MNKLNLVTVAALFTISACGGSGGSATLEPPADYTITIAGPSGDLASMGESVGLVLQVPETSISNIEWSQSSGPSVDFLGSNRKVIGFDVNEAGNYEFTVTFSDSAGAPRNAEYSFTASAASPVYINARLDHEANSQAKMSLRAYESFPASLSSVNWTQTAGPNATIDTTDELAIFFTAPAVLQDTLLQFQVTATDQQGNQSSDDVYVLLEPETIDSDSHFNDGRFSDISLADVYPYNSNSPYASEISECIYSNTTTTFCDLTKLPFIGSEDATPSVDQIMDRVLVSHDWIGDRFRTFLEQVDTGDDIKNLLGATTSIVISYDVKPSFFWAGTGAIYLDAKYFWVTPQERDTLNETPDFRSDFGEDLSFIDAWRIVKDNEYAFSIPAINSRETRSTEDSRYYALRVLYHELAHANDFFPPRAWSNAGGSDFPWTYSEQNDPDSTQLSISFPLLSQEMKDLAQVMFQGVTATQTQNNYTPTSVSLFFFPDRASNTYNYSTIREDYAMLAEEYMMGYRHGVLYDQAITGLAPNLIIDKGERGRVGDPDITPRAEFVIQRILPNVDTQAASATLATPAQLTAGISWFDSVAIPSQKNSAKINKNSFRQSVLTGRDFHPAKDLDINKSN